MKESKQVRRTSATALAWHPNFRVEETLPDTKIIRTSFVVNSVAVLGLMLVVALLVSREFELVAVKARIEQARTAVAANRPKFTQELAAQKEFAAAEVRLREIERFITSSFTASEFLAQIGKTLPRLIAIDAIELQNETIKMRGYLVGGSEQATVLAKAYVSQLTRDPVLAAMAQDIRLLNLTRDPQSGRLAFEVEMKAKPRR